MVSIHGRDDGSSSHGSGMREHGAGHGFAEPVSRWVQLAGAATSIAMVLGVVVWGYKLAVRDVSGVPVIRAIEGPARIAPEDPGGDLARHTGLSVNEVTGKGLAAPGPERVILAPEADRLDDSDQPMTGVRALAQVDRTELPELEAAEPATAPVPQVPRGTALSVADEALPVDGPEALEGAAASQIRTAAAEAAKVRPVARKMPVLPEGAAPSTEIDTVTPAEPQLALVPRDVPGVKSSPRPARKPAGLKAAAGNGSAAKPAANAAAKPAPVASVAEIDPATLPEGARVVQIGAFDTPEVARAEWDRVAARFGPLMEGKSRIVQEAVSGGRSFYRLRAAGFKNLDDSRRFCAALSAEGTNCIPTLAR